MQGEHLSELPEVEIFCNCALPKSEAMYTDLIDTAATIKFALANRGAVPMSSLSVDRMITVTAPISLRH